MSSDADHQHIAQTLTKYSLERENGLVDSLFYYLWAKDNSEESWKGYIPDTVVYRNRVVDSYYFTSTSGMIKRKSKNNLSPEAIEEAFLARAPEDFDIVAVYMENSTDDSGTTYVEYLDREQLHTFFKSRQKGMSAILQSFTLPNGSHNDTIRVTWSPSVCFVERRTNKNCLYSKNKLALERAVLYDGPENLSTTTALNSRNSLFRVAQSLCESIVSHVAVVTQHKARIARLLVDLRVSHSGKLYFLNCLSLRLESASLAERLILSETLSGTNRTRKHLGNSNKFLTYDSSKFSSSSKLPPNFQPDMASPSSGLSSNTRQIVNNLPLLMASLGTQAVLSGGVAPVSKKGLLNVGAKAVAIPRPRETISSSRNPSAIVLVDDPESFYATNNTDTIGSRPGTSNPSGNFSAPTPLMRLRTRPPVFPGANEVPMQPSKQCPSCGSDLVAHTPLGDAVNPVEIPIRVIIAHYNALVDLLGLAPHISAAKRRRKTSISAGFIREDIPFEYRYYWPPANELMEVTLGVGVYGLLSPKVPLESTPGLIMPPQSPYPLPSPNFHSNSQSNLNVSAGPVGFALSGQQSLELQNLEMNLRAFSPRVLVHPVPAVLLNIIPSLNPTEFEEMKNNEQFLKTLVPICERCSFVFLGVKEALLAGSAPSNAILSELPATCMRKLRNLQNLAKRATVLESRGKSSLSLWAFDVPPEYTHGDAENTLFSTSEAALETGNHSPAFQYSPLSSSSSKTGSFPTVTNSPENPESSATCSQQESQQPLEISNVGEKDPERFVEGDISASASTVRSPSPYKVKELPVLEHDRKLHAGSAIASFRLSAEDFALFDAAAVHRISTSTSTSVESEQKQQKTSSSASDKPVGKATSPAKSASIDVYMPSEKTQSVQKTIDADTPVQSVNSVSRDLRSSPLLQPMPRPSSRSQSQSRRRSSVTANNPKTTTTSRVVDGSKLSNESVSLVQFSSPQPIERASPLATYTNTSFASNTDSSNNQLYNSPSRSPTNNVTSTPTTSANPMHVGVPTMGMSPYGLGSPLYGGPSTFQSSQLFPPFSSYSTELSSSSFPIPGSYTLNGVLSGTMGGPTASYASTGSFPYPMNNAFLTSPTYHQINPISNASMQYSLVGSPLSPSRGPVAAGSPRKIAKRIERSGRSASAVNKTSSKTEKDIPSYMRPLNTSKARAHSAHPELKGNKKKQLAWGQRDPSKIHSPSRAPSTNLQTVAIPTSPSHFIEAANSTAAADKSDSRGRTVAMRSPNGHSGGIDEVGVKRPSTAPVSHSPSLTRSNYLVDIANSSRKASSNGATNTESSSPIKSVESNKNIRNSGVKKSEVELEKSQKPAITSIVKNSTSSPTPTKGAQSRTTADKENKGGFNGKGNSSNTVSAGVKGESNTKSASSSRIWSDLSVPKHSRLTMEKEKEKELEKEKKKKLLEMEKKKKGETEKKNKKKKGDDEQVNGNKAGILDKQEKSMDEEKSLLESNADNVISANSNEIHEETSDTGLKVTAHMSTSVEVTVVEPVPHLKQEEEEATLPSNATSVEEVVGIAMNIIAPPSKVSRTDEDAPPSPIRVRESEVEETHEIVKTVSSVSSALIPPNTPVILQLTSSLAQFFPASHRLSTQVPPPTPIDNLIRRNIVALAKKFHQPLCSHEISMAAVLRVDIDVPASVPSSGPETATPLRRLRGMLLLQRMPFPEAFLTITTANTQFSLGKWLLAAARGHVSHPPPTPTPRSFSFLDNGEEKQVVLNLAMPIFRVSFVVPAASLSPRTSTGNLKTGNASSSELFSSKYMNGSFYSHNGPILSNRNLNHSLGISTSKSSDMTLMHSIVPLSHLIASNIPVLHTVALEELKRMVEFVEEKSKSKLDAPFGAANIDAFNHPPSIRVGSIVLRVDNSSSNSGNYLKTGTSRLREQVYNLNESGGPASVDVTERQFSFPQSTENVQSTPSNDLLQLLPASEFPAPVIVRPRTNSSCSSDKGLRSSSPSLNDQEYLDLDREMPASPSSVNSTNSGFSVFSTSSNGVLGVSGRLLNHDFAQLSILATVTHKIPMKVLLPLEFFRKAFAYIDNRSSTASKAISVPSTAASGSKSLDYLVAFLQLVENVSISILQPSFVIKRVFIGGRSVDQLGSEGAAAPSVAEESSLVAETLTTDASLLHLIQLASLQPSVVPLLQIAAFALLDFAAAIYGLSKPYGRVDISQRQSAVLEIKQKFIDYLNFNRGPNSNNGTNNETNNTGRPPQLPPFVPVGIPAGVTVARFVPNHFLGGWGSLDARLGVPTRTSVQSLSPDKDLRRLAAAVELSQSVLQDATGARAAYKPGTLGICSLATPDGSLLRCTLSVVEGVDSQVNTVMFRLKVDHQASGTRTDVTIDASSLVMPALKLSAYTRGSPTTLNNGKHVLVGSWGGNPFIDPYALIVHSALVCNPLSNSVIAGNIEKFLSSRGKPSLSGSLEDLNMIQLIACRIIAADVVLSSILTSLDGISLKEGAVAGIRAKEELRRQATETLKLFGSGYYLISLSMITSSSDLSIPTSATDSRASSSFTGLPFVVDYSNDNIERKKQIEHEAPFLSKIKFLLQVTFVSKRMTLKGETASCEPVAGSSTFDLSERVFTSSLNCTMEPPQLGSVKYLGVEPCHSQQSYSFELDIDDLSRISLNPFLDCGV